MFGNLKDPDIRSEIDLVRAAHPVIMIFMSSITLKYIILTNGILRC